MCMGVLYFAAMIAGGRDPPVQGGGGVPTHPGEGQGAPGDPEALTGRSLSLLHLLLPLPLNSPKRRGHKSRSRSYSKSPSSRSPSRSLSHSRSRSPK